MRWRQLLTLRHSICAYLAVGAAVWLLHRKTNEVTPTSSFFLYNLPPPSRSHPPTLKRKDISCHFLISDGIAVVSTLLLCSLKEKKRKNGHHFFNNSLAGIDHTIFFQIFRRPRESGQLEMSHLTQKKSRSSSSVVVGWAPGTTLPYLHSCVVVLHQAQQTRPPHTCNQYQSIIPSKPSKKRKKKLCVLCVCVTDVMCIANNNGGESNF